MRRTQPLDFDPLLKDRMVISNPLRSLSISLLGAAALLCPSLVLSAPPTVIQSPQPPGTQTNPARRAGVLELRIGSETLRNPHWYVENGREDEAQQFWDKKEWDRVFTRRAAEEYNAILYWIEPWNKHAWQTFLIRHKEFPEARDLTPQQYDKLIEQVNWIFRRAHEHGLKNLLFTYSIVTTPAFAKVHGLERLPVSPSVDFRHTLEEMGPHFGVRNERTRAFTEAAVAELFQTYPDLDGLGGAMGEAVPGKRSTWYKEAIVPGLVRSGRNPMFLAASWMQPFQDFCKDMAPREVYPNTWLSLHANEKGCYRTWRTTASID
jgi:hypothetical protein